MPLKTDTADVSVDDRVVDAWVEMIDFGEAMLKAGFANRFGIDQVESQFQNWRKEQVAENDSRLNHLLSELSRRESNHAR